jgi:hypothetical protein
MLKLIIAMHCKRHKGVVNLRSLEISTPQLCDRECPLNIPLLLFLNNFYNNAVCITGAWLRLSDGKPSQCLQSHHVRTVEGYSIFGLSLVPRLPFYCGKNTSQHCSAAARDNRFGEVRCHCYVHKATLCALCDIVLQCELCICLQSCSRHHVPSHSPLAPRRCLGLEGLVVQAASHRKCSTPTYSLLHRAYRWYIKFSIAMQLDDSSEHARSHATSSCISNTFCVADVDEEDTYLHLPYLQSCLHQRIQTLAK